LNGRGERFFEPVFFGHLDFVGDGIVDVFGGCGRKFENAKFRLLFRLCGFGSG
jgi:hypothetical protein